MITFGRFGHKEDIEKEKKRFLELLNELLYELNYLRGRKNYSENEIIKPLKDAIKREKKLLINPGYTGCVSCFLEEFGLSYYTLTPEEREEVYNMDFTYENWKKKSIKLIKNFFLRMKNACPETIWFCFEDIYFLFHIQIMYKNEFRINNFIKFIRDYFILDNTTTCIKEYRDPVKYKEIQKEVINKYPLIKEKYGMSRIFDKILSYIFVDNDYNHEKTKNILDNYYKNKNNIENVETIKLKDKYD